MNISNQVEIEWPDGRISFACPGELWLEKAKEVGIDIPTGCLGGSCGACEIEVNGKVVRACIKDVPNIKSRKLKVDFFVDPYW